LTGQGINVRHACRTLCVSESGYYAWKGRPDPPRTLRRIWLAGEIAEVHKASGGTYGALRVTAELRYGRNIIVGHNAVETIMRELGIKGLPTRRRPKGRRLAEVISLDLVRRAFLRDRPNELWLTDIAEHHPRGKAVLLRGPGHVLPPGGRLVDRQHPDHPAGAQRARDGHPALTIPRINQCCEDRLSLSLDPPVRWRGGGDVAEPGGGEWGEPRMGV
jgi:transposase